jgi:hypothetical protein
MTRKDYQAIAHAVHMRYLESRNTARRKVVELAADIADVFSADNERFNRALFYSACGFTAEDIELANSRTTVQE